VNILIVESKAKIKTIQKVLGRSQWRVLATGGHIECLPADRKRHDRKEVKKAYWSNRAGELPQPPWVWEDRGEAAVDAIRAEAAHHDEVVFYIATDPDREGERIAWHLERHLRELGACQRVTFQEITARAIESAVASPGDLDRALVDAALVRVFIDRLVGWRSRNTAKAFVERGTTSMGRVQTPTLGFVVQRELEREAHVPIAFFEVSARTTLAEWKVRFHEPDDAEAWRGDDGRPNAHRTASRELAESAEVAVRESGTLEVESVTSRNRRESPKQPFRTDTLLRAASSQFGWSMKKTNKLASVLYEAGHVTYIRTDSTRLSEEAVLAGQAVVVASWGQAALGAAPTGGETGAGVQDAHEAIRPTDPAAARLPDDVDADARRLYALIRARTLAALMAPSLRTTLSLRALAGAFDRRLEAALSWFDDPGWRRAFEPLSGPVDTAPIRVEPGDGAPLGPATEDAPNPLLREDATRPPARYSPAALVKQMRDAGIGRPSTYASMIDKLGDKKLIVEDSGLCPTPGGRRIWLEAAPLFTVRDDEPVFDVDYTARLERRLDAVAEGTASGAGVWEELRDEFRTAHEAALQARDSGKMLPRTRQRLADYLAASPEIAREVGDLDALGEVEGRALASRLRGAGAALLPTQAQNDWLNRLLEGAGLSAIEAAELAGLEVSEPPSRSDVSALIDHLKEQVDLSRTPSDKQLRLVESLGRKLALDESEACALVGCARFEELTGGRGGTASALIDLLKARQRAAKT